MTHPAHTGPRSAVGNVSGYRCVSDCRSRGREFDPGPVPYFRGDRSWNDFYGHSPPFRWFIQEGLLSVTSESMCTNYWLTACSSLPRKCVVRWTDRPAMTIAVDLGRKATKQTKSTQLIAISACGDGDEVGVSFSRSSLSFDTAFKWLLLSAERL